MSKAILTRVVRLAAIVCACFMAVALSGCEFGTFSDHSLDNPKQTILDFIEAMQAEEFDDAAAEAAMENVGNYSTMGFEQYGTVESDPLEKTLFDLLRNSYDVSFSNSDLDPVASPYQGVDMTVTGKQAFVTFTFTSLKLEKLSGPLAEIVGEIGAERMYNGEEYNTEQSALALVEEVFAQNFDTNDLSDYCVSRKITLELNYTDEGWKLVISEEFYSALLGK